MEKLNERTGDKAQMLKTAPLGSGCDVVRYGAQVKRTAGREENTAATDTLWLAMHVNNNNNNALELEGNDDVFAAEQQQQKHNAEHLNAQKRWKRRVAKPLRAFCEAVGVTSNSKPSAAAAAAVASMDEPHVAVAEQSKTVVTGSGIVEDAGGGGDGGATTISSGQEQVQQNGAVGTPNNSNSSDNRHAADTVTTTTTQYAAIAIPAVSASAAHGLSAAASTIGEAAAAAATVDIDYDAAVGAVGAVSLTPPDNSHSNRTSINNSTENLSYSSDNYYPDDLILLGEDDDVEAEEISLNSDDCVYAYRGDGADFDNVLDPFSARAGSLDTAGMCDDETDFLEMDFEPDPLSEIEYGFVGTYVTPAQTAHTDAFLLQRDSCHLSGRHSVTMGHHTPITQRPLFSSPIDDMPPPKLVVPKASLQSQALLNKNFARITLHLDQIKGDVGDYDGPAHTRSERLSALGVDDLSDGVDMAKLPATMANTPSAHSLPNTLHAHFLREVSEKKETRAHVAKVTGAKPKRLSTFSTSSSTSSKNSSKSRTSLRSAYAALPLCNSCSFDERSVSCAEFRCAGVAASGIAPSPATDDCLPKSTQVATVATCDDFNLYDETCLDCLEKEFLANTIGKALEPHVCPKCRRRSGGGSNSSSRTYFARTEQSRCRSGSPSFFLEMREEDLFETASEFLQQTHISKQRKDNWATVAAKGEATPTAGTAANAAAVGAKQAALILQESGATQATTNQRRTTCDNFKDEQLLQNCLLTEPEIATISTVNLTEETLVQALDKLHIVYNAELLKSHFRCNSSTYNLHKAPAKEYKSLKHFLLHASKQHGNHPKLKRLIELATLQQVTVQFKKDTNITQTEMVPVKVADILHQWTRTQNLELLKQLDKRYVETNVLGKIANIIRQAQQRCSTRSPLPEFISIPQYYASGYLILTKTC